MFQAARRIFAFFALALFASFGACNTLTLGIVPQQSAKKLAETWQPLINYISEHADIDVVFKTAKDIPTFEQRLAEGEYDIAYMNPFHFLSTESRCEGLHRSRLRFHLMLMSSLLNS